MLLLPFLKLLTMLIQEPKEILLDLNDTFLSRFFISQFSYAAVVWMFRNRKLNSHINRIRKRVLRIVYQDHNSTFEELLAKDGSFKIHDRNLQRLLIETFKVKMKLAPEIINEVFDITESHIL